MAISRTEMTDAAVALYEEIVKGENESNIAKLFGWDEETYKRVRKRMLELKAEEMRALPREHVYVDYVIAQNKNIRDLDTVVAKLRSTKMDAASIGAIRLRSDIQDKIILKGQEFGLIKKEADQLNVIAGIVLADMPRTELVGAITKELTSMKSMLDRYGDAPITALPASTGFHYGPQAASYIDADAEAEPVESVAPPPKMKAKR